MIADGCREWWFRAHGPSVPPKSAHHVAQHTSQNGTTKGTATTGIADIENSWTANRIMRPRYCRQLRRIRDLDAIYAGCCTKLSKERNLFRAAESKVWNSQKKYKTFVESKDVVARRSLLKASRVTGTPQGWPLNLQHVKRIGPGGAMCARPNPGEAADLLVTAGCTY